MELDQRFAEMHALVESPPFDLPLGDWRPLYDRVLAFASELILELGRGWGNSTCVFTEGAHAVGARVTSVGFDSEHAWAERTAPRLRERLVTSDWFAPLTVLDADIRTLDFAPILAGSRRVLVYWDAHGNDVAAAVIDGIFPLLPKDSLVTVDDVWDLANAPEGTDGWPHIVRGSLGSIFDEVEAIHAYLPRNGIAYVPRGEQIEFVPARS